MNRVPSTRKPVFPPSRDTPPALLRSQIPATQSASRTLRNGATELANPSFHLQNQARMDWTPEQLYESQAPAGNPPRQRHDFPGYYQNGESAYGSVPSSNNSSRTDLPYSASSSTLSMGDYPVQKRVGFTQENRIIPPESAVSSSLSRSVSQPVMSKPASFSSSSSSLSRPPPPPDRHRPKRIVLPRPLQQQDPNHSYQTYAPPSSIVPPAKPAAAAAAVIPMHDAKFRGNMLKKRPSTNTAPQPNAPEPQAMPARKPSTSKGIFGFGSHRDSEASDDGVPKARRKLSKRKT